MSLFSRHAHTHRVILHIGSGTVRGASLKEIAGSPTEITSIYRSDVPIRERVQARTLENHIFEATERVLKQIHATTQQKIDRVDVVFGSPWFSARTKTITIEKTEPFTVTHSLIRDIGEKESARIKKDIPGHELVLEEKITRMRLNGYESTNPFSQKVHSLELVLFVSFVTKEFVEKARTVVDHALSPRHILFHSFPSVAHATMSRLWNNDPQFAYIDVGSEVTEVIFSEHGALTETFSFPLGTNHLIRAIAKKRGISYDMAGSLLTLYSNGTGEQSAMSDIEKILTPLHEEWCAYIEQVIHESGNAHEIVQKMYLSADESSAGFWSTALEDHTHRAVVLTADAFSSFIKIDSHFVPDPIVLLEALFIDTSNTFPHLQSLRG